MAFCRYQSPQTGRSVPDSENNRSGRRKEAVCPHHLCCHQYSSNTKLAATGSYQEKIFYNYQYNMTNILLD
jgi:hypothetical protein